MGTCVCIHACKRKREGGKIKSLALTSSTTANKSQIVELRDLIFNLGRAVSQLAAIIFVIASSDSNLSTVADFGEYYDLERCWERLVRSPMIW